MQNTKKPLRERWEKYERYKTELARMGLTSWQYETILRMISEALML